MSQVGFKQTCLRETRRGSDRSRPSQLLSGQKVKEAHDLHPIRLDRVALTKPRGFAFDLPFDGLELRRQWRRSRRSWAISFSRRCAASSTGFIRTSSGVAAAFEIRSRLSRDQGAEGLGLPLALLGQVFGGGILRCRCPSAQLGL